VNFSKSEKKTDFAAADVNQCYSLHVLHRSAWAIENAGLKLNGPKSQRWNLKRTNAHDAKHGTHSVDVSKHTKS